MIPGGMSDLTIPSEDPHECVSRAACYCHDNGHTPTREGTVCLACGIILKPECGNTSCVIEHERQTIEEPPLWQ